MNFRQRHPYLFWQLIGWGLLLGDFIFLVVSALLEFGEWCYPVIVFTFIAAIMAIGASPFIVRFRYQKAVPHNKYDYAEKLIRSKIEAIRYARKLGHPVLAAFVGFFSMIFFFFAAYILGEHVHLALGFASIVMALAAPFIIWGSYSAGTTRRFFTVKNGDKLVDLTPPDNPKILVGEDPRTVVTEGEPDAVLLNFFYNWLRPYLRTERLTLYRIPAPDLCRDFQPANILRYEHILFCIPNKQLDILGKEKTELFARECEIMGAYPFSFFVTDAGGTANDGNDVIE